MVNLHDVTYKAYVDILKRELIPAIGCTEPIAIAYAAAKVRELLESKPDKVHIAASGNIIKNVKSVTVPNTDGLKGIEAAAAAGIIAGDASSTLEVISRVSTEQKKEIREYLKEASITVGIAQSDLVLDILIEASAGKETAAVRITDNHTHISHMEKNGKTLLNEQRLREEAEDATRQSAMLNVDDIIMFADICDLDDVRKVIARQIAYNSAISQEGLRKEYGAGVGRTICECYNADDVMIRAIAGAAAGSDARMNGCELPVIINSGSGNQGITVSVPVIEYAKAYDIPEDKLYRALIISNLVSIHQKKMIGSLSAFCGAVSAGCAAAAGISYLLGGNRDEIAHTFVNGMAINSGLICDGAKPSCAGKIASSVCCGLLALNMSKTKRQFRDGEGIVKKGIEHTMSSIGRLGKDGMRETDREILEIMIEK